MAAEARGGTYGGRWTTSDRSYGCWITKYGGYWFNPFINSSKHCGQGSTQENCLCIECQAGYFYENGDCITCNSGKWSSTASLSCTDCTGGKYSEHEGASSCTDCTAGKYGTSVSSTTDCTDYCTAGKYSKEGAISCTNCTAGRYGTSIGSTSNCSNFCNAGKYSLSGASSCTDCTAGKYGTSIGSGTDCTDLCPTGKYSEVGALSCTNCIAGKFQADVGQGFCNTCPDDKISPIGSPFCLGCTVGQFADFYKSKSCVDCAYTDACDGTDKCMKGHKGYACGACDNGWFLLNNKCHICPELGEFLWIFAAMFAAFVCFLIYQVTGFDSNDTKRFFTIITIVITHFQVISIYFSFNITYPALVVEVIEWIVAICSFDFPSLMSPECSTGTIGYSERWWISVTIPFLLLLPFVFILVVNIVNQSDLMDEPEWFRILDASVKDRLFSIVTHINPYGTDQNIINKVNSVKWFPDIDDNQIIEIKNYFQITGMSKTYQINRNKSIRQSKAINSIMVVLSITYVYGLYITMEAWHCYDFGDDGKYELISYPDITCDGSDMRWLGIMIFSFFSGIFFIIGVNSIYFCILKNIKTTDETMVRRYGFIFLRYVEDCYMWELVTNIRKIFTIIAGVALSRSGVGQVCMMLVVVIIIDLFFRPPAQMIERTSIIIIVLFLNNIITVFIIIYFFPFFFVLFLLLLLN